MRSLECAARLFDCKMAESVQTSCGSPKLKRRRLDNEDRIASPLSPSDTKFDRCLIRNEDRRFAVPYEVSSTSDPQSDTYGGDSGFHELTPPVSTEYIDSTSVDGLNLDIVYDQHIDLVNGIHIPEADSSQADILGEPSSSIYPAVDDLSCLVPDDADNEADEIASTISDISGLSDLSDFSGQDWKPTAGPVSWVQRQMNLGADPRSILLELVPKGTVIPYHLDEVTLWKIIVNMLSEPPRRKKLTEVNTLDDAIRLLKTCTKIIVLTGAGVSVSCGIPDFRSRNGIYARLSKDYPDLPDPQAMFDINYFRKDPRPFFKFAKEIYPGQFQPSPSHHFISLLEKQSKLLRNYTQNIDTLEQAAGIQRVITCHGSFATASCTSCGYKVSCSEIKDDIFTQRIPYCPYCPSDLEEMAVMKPDIVFFGEGLSDEFHQTMAKDKDVCDLLIVIGSSLKVRPVALIPSSIPPEVPQILINREPLKHLTFDVELLGDCDIIITELCNRLGGDWLHISGNKEPLHQITELPDFKSSLNYSVDSEVNNNVGTIQADTTTVHVANGLSNWSNSVATASVEEESCSCDCNNLSNIRIDDRLDSTVESETKNSPDSTCNNSVKPQSTKEPDTRQPPMWEPKNKQSLASKLPENTFFYVPPSRYIFHGAEVYSDGNIDKCQGEPSEVSSSSADEEESDVKEATSSGIHTVEDPIEIALCLDHPEAIENAIERNVCESPKRIGNIDVVSLSCS